MLWSHFPSFPIFPVSSPGSARPSWPPSRHHRTKSMWNTTSQTVSDLNLQVLAPMGKAQTGLDGPINNCTPANRFTWIPIFNPDPHQASFRVCLPRHAFLIPYCRLKATGFYGENVVV